MSRIISAMDYGERVVMRVCHNPTDPEWVHIVGSPERDRTGLEILQADGRPKLLESAHCPEGNAYEVCHNCRYNWDVAEIIFDGLELLDSDGWRLADDILAAEALRRATRPSAPQSLAGIIGLNS